MLTREYPVVRLGKCQYGELESLTLFHVNTVCMQIFLDEIRSLPILRPCRSDLYWA